MVVTGVFDSRIIIESRSWLEFFDGLVYCTYCIIRSFRTGIEPNEAGSRSRANHIEGDHWHANTSFLVSMWNRTRRHLHLRDTVLLLPRMTVVQRNWYMPTGCRDPSRTTKPCMILHRSSTWKVATSSRFESDGEEDGAIIFIRIVLIILEINHLLHVLLKQFYLWDNLQKVGTPCESRLQLSWQAQHPLSKWFSWQAEPWSVFSLVGMLG